jgi:exonuclease VII small subunit
MMIANRRRVDDEQHALDSLETIISALESAKDSLEEADGEFDNIINA